ILPVLRRQVVAGCEPYLDALLARPGDQSQVDCEILLANGRWVSQRMQWVGEGADGEGGCIWMHEDITLDRQTQQRARLALLDPLTDLLNRHGLFDALHAAIGRASQARTGLTLITMGLDDFKHTNDVAGHRVGDRILVKVAELLSQLFQPEMAAARMGGDEFAIIVPGQDAAQAASLATSLVQSISALRFEPDALRIRIGCSVGVAFYPLDASSADQLVACADRAMGEAKIGGKNGYCLYQDNAAHLQAEFDRVAWNGRIHGALRDHRLQLHFQPVHRMSDLGIVYYEALVRMIDEDDASQLIGPTEFVPYAERSGKIRQIDRWVFQACVDKLTLSPPAVCIAANLSARSLDDPTFVDVLRALLQRSHVDPARLHIELTETAAMGDLIAARPMIAALRSVGCAVHLDDFGSGFSSFAHLKLLEVDGIKIDGSFIRDLTSDPSNQLVVASLVKIARSLNKTTVAECVEDSATLNALRELGVDHVQGFHLGRPARKLAERAFADRPHW
ncbi:MAG: EAL domain-containing protein, partial [Burkholderiaceae bacterium]